MYQESLSGRHLLFDLMLNLSKISDSDTASPSLLRGKFQTDCNYLLSNALLCFITSLCLFYDSCHFRLLDLLPLGNYQMLRCFVCLLYHCSVLNSSKTQQVPKSISISAGPSLLGSSHQDYNAISVATQALEFMLDNCVTLFGEACPNLFEDVLMKRSSQSLSDYVTQRASSSHDASRESSDADSGAGEPHGELLKLVISWQMQLFSNIVSEG